ncbi:transposase [Variovorax sp. Root318D1]|uniref:transposase n=1 Tax=Variovorax sp. Root318D1 TaxID=1736513 RepID=UPI000A6D7DDE|nr:transposase [Variovorax sp. Root318D1]
MSTIPDQQGGTRRRRRIHSDEFKANAVASCMQPGMSMAAVAMVQGVNANLLRRWVRDAEMNSATTVVSATTTEMMVNASREARKSCVRAFNTVRGAQ